MSKLLGFVGIFGAVLLVINALMVFADDQAMGMLLAGVAYLIIQTLPEKEAK